MDGKGFQRGPESVDFVGGKDGAGRNPQLVGWSDDKSGENHLRVIFFSPTNPTGIEKKGFSSSLWSLGILLQPVGFPKWKKGIGGQRLARDGALDKWAALQGKDKRGGDDALR